MFLKKLKLWPFKVYINEVWGKIGYIIPAFPYKKYNIKNKCIFIHIPRNAGTSILSMLGDTGGRSHRSFMDYQMSNSERFKNYFKFAIVRNPYDRIVSVYEYLKNGGNKSHDLYFSEIIEKENGSFDWFVNEFIDEYRIHEVLLLKPQYLFLYDYKNELQVDYIARFECLEKDIPYICQQINMPHKKMPKLNQSTNHSWEKYYEYNRTIETVGRLYKKDFEFFGYDIMK